MGVISVWNYEYRDGKFYVYPAPEEEVRRVQKERDDLTAEETKNA